MATETTGLLRGDAEKGTVDGKTYSMTINIEGLRLFAFICMDVMFAVCMIISKIWVFKPEDPDEKVFGFITPRGERDVTDTVIYKIFGFNHTCNVVDFNPAKEFAAIVVFLYILPFQLFLILGYFRNKLAYMNDEISKLTHDYTKFITIPCIVFTSFVTLWFVNSPQDNFTMHYIPYMCFQISLELVHVSQLWYYIDLGKVAYGISPRVAKIYVWTFVTLCCISQTLVITILMGHPILDSANNPVHQEIFKMFANVVAFMTLIMPLVFSGWEYYESGDTNTITFAHQ